MKRFLKKLWNTIAGLFGKAEKFLQLNVVTAVGVVERLKSILDSPVLDIMTALIPGTLDDAAKDFLRKTIPLALKDMYAVQELAYLPADEFLKAVVNRIRVAPDEQKNIFYHNLASLLITRLSDGKIDWADAVALAEYYYQSRIKK